MAGEQEGVQIEPGSLRRLVQASRTWDAVSRREMRAGLRAAAAPALNAAKAEVLGPVPSKANQTTGLARKLGMRRFSVGRTSHSGKLRSALAAGASLSIRTGREGASGVTGEGVRITATGKKLDPDESPMLKAYMSTTFRHPVFGDRSTFASQHGKNWFYNPLRTGKSQYQAAIVDAIEKASAAIARD